VRRSRTTVAQHRVDVPVGAVVDPALVPFDRDPPPGLTFKVLYRSETPKRAVDPAVNRVHSPLPVGLSVHRRRAVAHLSAAAVGQAATAGPVPALV
jgi:hypothetical protein